ncbi:hypothetical protein [Candidatus Methanoperedens nitratireducens]|uniref:Uncharacterized protein n=1 Tax=Candidatus Methanoperedens nitratireducens TaxID=1392998 RepID=A0A284VU74_9EURY|nr:hypothetical protein [Candidatus Methanoperedens nitroreducens]SNQ62854.1 hypothetical protein MNV_920021 [Candidatus Methanoperedens nitroreducens]
MEILNYTHHKPDNNPKYQETNIYTFQNYEFWTNRVDRSLRENGGANL